MAEYGKRWTKPPAVKVNIEGEDLPHGSFDKSLNSDVSDFLASQGSPVKGSLADVAQDSRYNQPLSKVSTPNKEKMREWLRRTYSGIEGSKLSEDAVPDIITKSAKSSTGDDDFSGLSQHGGYNRFLMDAEDNADVDFDDPFQRAIAFHETGHAMTGLGDSSVPSKEEFVPFYRGNVSPKQSRADVSMQPFDTTYTALRDKLDAEAEPSFMDKIAYKITGDTPPPKPSSYYDASSMRKQMMRDNTKKLVDKYDRSKK